LLNGASRKLGARETNAAGAAENREFHHVKHTSVPAIQPAGGSRSKNRIAARFESAGESGFEAGPAAAGDVPAVSRGLGGNR
jgi:hypothetical protein